MKKKNSTLKKILLVLLVLFLILLIYAGASIYLSANALTISTFHYDSEKISHEIKITALTDVHSHIFGKANERLVKKLEKEKPDIILVVGDGLNWYDESHDGLTAFIQQMLRIAPVYFTVGNHEVTHMDNFKDYQLLNDLQAVGAVIVDKNYVDITINEESVRIGGLYGSAYNTKNVSTQDYISSDIYQFLSDFENTNDFKLMLSHQPQTFIPNDAEEPKWDIDLVVCGHEHGGQVRLPFIGAIYDPHEYMGWFPEYVDGTHLINGIPVIISRGLGTYTKGASFVPPRFDNIPEIVNIQIN